MTGTCPRVTVFIEPAEAGPGSMFASGRIEPKPATVNHLAPGDRLRVEGAEAIRREERDALKAAGSGSADGVDGSRMAWARYGEALGDFSKTEPGAPSFALVVDVPKLLRELTPAQRIALADAFGLTPSSAG